MSLQFLEAALLNKNVQAFLFMIRASEGTAAPDGYTYLFDSSPDNTLRFTSFAKHPDIIERFNGYASSAAGAYQILFRIWSYIQKKYNLPDFSPHSQDIAACELISERNALELIIHGDFDTALQLCSNEWASLPNSDYNQPEHSVATVTEWYTQAGGEIAA